SIFGIAGEDDDDGRVASLHGVNTGSTNSVPENPNKKDEKLEKNKVQNTNDSVELINDEQRQELLDIATKVANLRGVNVEAVIGAFGGLDDLESSKFESTKNKINRWFEKAKKEADEAEKTNDEVSKQEQEKDTKDENKPKKEEKK